MFLFINNQSIYYQKVGKGTDLIMLHGWGGDVSTFWPLVDLLKDKFTLYLIDLPGFGRSELPQRSWRVVDYAKLILNFIKTQKLKNPIILGHSLGGRIAIKLTSSHPGVFGKMILVSSAGIRPKQEKIKFLAYIPAKFIKFLLPNLFGLRDKARYYLYKTLESDYLEAGKLQQTLINILAEDLSDDLKKIKAETLLIWGEKDRVVPLKYGNMMYQLIANARLEVMENVGHFPYLENPKLFVYYVKDFS